MNTAASMFNRATAAAASAKRRLLAETTGAPNHAVPVNRQALQQLVAMGFNAGDAERALAEVGGEDVELASTLLLEGASGSSRSPGFSPGSLVKIGGVTANDGPTELNGCCARIIKFDAGRDRYLVDLGGDHRVLIKGDHLTAAPPGSTPTGNSPKRSSTSTSLTAAKNSMWEAKKRAETLLKKAMTTTSGPSSPATGHPTTVPATPLAPAGATHEQRRAAAQAAEARLTAAQQRNAGTMDDWRRHGRQQWLAEQEAARRQGQGGPTGDPSTQMSSCAAAAVPRQGPSPSLPPTASRPGPQDYQDEEEAIQRAINASLETAKLEGHVEPDAQQFQSQSHHEEDQGDVDPEVVELHLQQAISEEELSLQTALAESLSAHRFALELEVSEIREAGGSPSPELIHALKEAKLKEHQVLEACAAIEERLHNLRDLVAALAPQETAEASAGEPAGTLLPEDKEREKEEKEKKEAEKEEKKEEEEEEKVAAKPKEESVEAEVEKGATNETKPGLTSSAAGEVAAAAAAAAAVVAAGQAAKTSAEEEQEETKNKEEEQEEKKHQHQQGTNAEKQEGEAAPAAAVEPAAEPEADGVRSEGKPAGEAEAEAGAGVGEEAEQQQERKEEKGGEGEGEERRKEEGKNAGAAAAAPAPEAKAEGDVAESSPEANDDAASSAATEIEAADDGLGTPPDLEEEVEEEAESGAAAGASETKPPATFAPPPRAEGGEKKEETEEEKQEEKEEKEEKEEGQDKSKDTQPGAEAELEAKVPEVPVGAEPKLEEPAGAAKTGDEEEEQEEAEEAKAVEKPAEAPAEEKVAGGEERKENEEEEAALTVAEEHKPSQHEEKDDKQDEEEEGKEKADKELAK